MPSLGAGCYYYTLILICQHLFEIFLKNFFLAFGALMNARQKVVFGSLPGNNPSPPAAELPLHKGAFFAPTRPSPSRHLSVPRHLPQKEEAMSRPNHRRGGYYPPAKRTAEDVGPYGYVGGLVS